MVTPADQSPVAPDEGAHLRVLPFAAPEAHRLPLPPTSLVGREREADEVAALLVRRDVRLVTLTGPGGVGKTRLALRVAGELSPAFAEVAFVGLAPIADPALVIAVIAQELGVTESGDLSLRETLVRGLRGRHLLLVLDNLEHVAAAASDLAFLLTECPRLTILATSRIRLRLQAEHHYPVAPLALPSRHRTPALPALERIEAVALFVRRARAARPDFALTKDNAGAVAAICRRLDGLPLAIELAAARSTVLSPPALLDRLTNRLPLLTGGAGDVPIRQRTLRDAIAWSYDLLDATGQDLFRRLAVFAGGCDLDAASAVAGGTPADPADTAAIDQISTLVDHSLLRQETTGDRWRFRMLETVREFALGELAAAGDLDAAQRRHAAHYLALAERAETALLGPEQVPWLERLDVESDNLRAVLAWAVDPAPSATDRLLTADADPAPPSTGPSTDGPPAPSRGEIGLRLAAALWRYWDVRGRLTEGQGWLDRALAGGGAGPPDARAKALNRLANFETDLGDYPRAWALFEESLAISRRADRVVSIADTLNSMGLLAAMQGDFGRGRLLFEESLILRREIGNPVGIAMTLSNLGLTVNAEGDQARAWDLLGQALALQQDLGDLRHAAYTGHDLGEVALDRGQIDDARALFASSLDTCLEMGDSFGIAYALHGLGRVALARGDIPEAAARFGDALALRREMGDKRGIAEGIATLGAVAATRGDGAVAADLLGAAEALRETLGVVLSGAERTRLVHAAAAARARVNPGAFAAAWATGRARSETGAGDRAATVAATIAAIPNGAADGVAGDGAPEPASASSSPPGAVPPLGLTTREHEILVLIAGGQSDKAIGEALFISHRTVMRHAANIYAKLGVTTRSAAAAVAVRHGLA